MSDTPADEQAKRQEKYSRARQMLQSGLAHIQHDAEALERYLSFRARFWSFSMSNVMMIQAQRPDAQFCMGFRQWIKQGRSVKKGEHGILIWVPAFRKPNQTEIQAGADPIQKKLFFTPGYVFDISQTEPIPDHPDPITYAPPLPLIQGDDFQFLSERFVSAAGQLGYAVEFKSCGTANGYADLRHKLIAIDPERPVNSQTRTLCHELAHAIAHDLSKDRKVSRQVKEVEAEGSAFLVCASLGLDTSAYSFGYLKDWSGGDDALLVSTLDVIDDTARAILTAIGSPLLRSSGEASVVQSPDSPEQPFQLAA